MHAYVYVSVDRWRARAVHRTWPATGTRQGLCTAVLCCAVHHHTRVIWSEARARMSTRTYVRKRGVHVRIYARTDVRVYPHTCVRTYVRTGRWCVPLVLLEACVHGPWRRAVVKIDEARHSATPVLIFSLIYFRIQPVLIFFPVTS
jgi:hypothetical protein